jgi:Tol biopolymer transport system component/C-terminal processing protease CtpA/Prc
MPTDTTATRPYLRTPSINPGGDTIAFVYATDIWLVDARGGPARRLTSHPAAHSSPAWAPDGSALAFTSSRTGNGDVYVMPLGGGDVRRITYHESHSAVEAWSADGRFIYFTSYRSGNGSSIYRAPADGGTPIEWISQPFEQISCLAVSPDGAQLAFTVGRDRWWRRGPNPYGGADIWVVSNTPDASDFRKVGEYNGLNRWPMWAADGSGLFFVSDRGGIENIWFQPLDGGQAQQRSFFTDGRMHWPSISRDGRTIVFERDFGIWRLDPRNGEVAPITVDLAVDAKVTPVRVVPYARELSELALAPDGKKIAIVARGKVFADFADKETDKEQRQGPSFGITAAQPGSRERDVAWSPDSRRLLYASDRNGDEDLFLYDFAARSESALTSGPGRKTAPAYSPDGAWIAYAYGTTEIRLINSETREERPFVRANFLYGASFAWSPDSKWVVFVAQDRHFFSNLYVQHIDETEAHQISFLSNLEGGFPIWAPNGRFILFTTGQYRSESQVARVDLVAAPPQFREAEFEKLFEVKGGDERRANGDHGEPKTEEGEQKPAEPPKKSENGDKKAPPKVEINFTGIQRRLRFLTPAQMDARALCVNPESRDLIFLATVAGKYQLWSLPLDEQRADQSPRQITNGSGSKSYAQFAPDGKSFFYLDQGQVTNRKFPSGDATTVQIVAEVVVDFSLEKRQIFNECWRDLRDYFYDESLRGLDWARLREQYAPLIAGAQTNSDLYALINLMIGELRASHLGVNPNGYSYPQDGHTGIIFDRVELAQSGRLRVAALVPDSPAASAEGGAGVRVGDYLLAVNGTPIGPRVNVDMLLQRTANRRVRLQLGETPDDPKPREVAIRPLNGDQMAYLHYRAWAYANEEYVHRISGGRIGYLHIRAMSYEALQRFLADLDVETYEKEGVVVDTRFNGGGHTATFILDVLARRSVLFSSFRDLPLTYADHLAGNRVLNKPTVLVTNERSMSNTEMFAEMYRRLGIGKVVGRPTAGGVIWTYSHRLIDNSTLRVPRLKVVTQEGEDLEGRGRDVDVDVPLPIGEYAPRKDSQLDAAVATLLAQIDARPPE